MEPGRSQQPLVVYVDVDDTLIRTTGTKRIPISAVISHVRSLYENGAQLFCWSSGGADYAKRISTELHIADCFIAFLPKPNVLLDDQAIASWRRLVGIHPSQCESESAESYRSMLDSGSGPKV